MKSGYSGTSCVGDAFQGGSALTSGDAAPFGTPRDPARTATGAATATPPPPLPPPPSATAAARGVTGERRGEARGDPLFLPGRWAGAGVSEAAWACVCGDASGQPQTGDSLG